MKGEDEGVFAQDVGEVIFNVLGEVGSEIWEDPNEIQFGFILNRVDSDELAELMRHEVLFILYFLDVFVLYSFEVASQSFPHLLNPHVTTEHHIHQVAAIVFIIELY